VQAVAELQKFIQGAPWNTLNSSYDVTSSFSVLMSGYVFNFATQDVTQPPISFATEGQPTSTQLARVGPVAHSALDRMYSFATASSTQHQKSLANYWTTVLQQTLVDLPVFMSALSTSPILLPFNAALPSQPRSITNLLTSPLPSSFPPPLACYPGLSSAQMKRIESIEGPAFGLSPIRNASRFNSACYSDRPVYGVLDILRLRLPFIDSRSGVARQAALLKLDVAPRVIVYSGEVLSAMPGSSNMTMTTEDQSDPRRYGTLRQLDHVVLKYLSSIPDVNVATALVNYVLASETMPLMPPTNASMLYQSIAMIPVMEVAVFGSIDPSDITSAVSAFATSPGPRSLFFGSDQGNSLRTWAITGCSITVVWSESALSPLIVRDNDLSDSIFNQTWTAVSTALRNNVPGVNVANITEAFRLTHKFSPT